MLNKIKINFVVLENNYHFWFLKWDKQKVYKIMVTVVYYVSTLNFEFDVLLFKLKE